MKTYHFKPSHYFLLSALFLSVSVFGMAPRLFIPDFLRTPLLIIAVLTALLVFYFVTRPVCPAKHTFHLTIVLTAMALLFYAAVFLFFPGSATARLMIHSAAWLVLPYPALFLYQAFRHVG